MRDTPSVLMRPWGHMHHRVSGQARRPAVIFANALGTDLRMWDAVAARLPHLSIVRFDARGHGLSATPDQDWTVQDVAGDVLALMDHLALPQAVVVGCSMGGLVAQAFGLLHPDRASGLILCNTAARIGDAASWQARIDAVVSGIAPVADAILARWFTKSFLETPDALLWRSMLLANDLQGYTRACRALGLADLRDQVSATRPPVLMIGGSEDPGTTPALMQATADLIPQARLEILQGSGHLPAIDAPGAMAALIDAFVKDLP